MTHQPGAEFVTSRVVAVHGHTDAYRSDRFPLTIEDRAAETTNTQADNASASSFIDLIYETSDGYMTVSTMSNKEWQASGRRPWC